tara:strand:+ start:4199 stop:4819 length:621 start_codon:yes stop_codon:yes gene_type:complete
MAGPLVPILIGAATIARLASPRIASLLTKRGLAKSAPKDAKVSSGKALSKKADLPRKIQNELVVKRNVKKTKNETMDDFLDNIGKHKGSSPAVNRARIKREQKKEEAAEAAKKAAKRDKPKTERQADPHTSSQQRRQQKLDADEEFQKFLSEADDKIAQQSRVTRSPSSDTATKGMRLPRKGEDYSLKKSGGKVYARGSRKANYGG